MGKEISSVSHVFRGLASCDEVDNGSEVYPCKFFRKCELMSTLNNSLIVV